MEASLPRALAAHFLITTRYFVEMGSGSHRILRLPLEALIWARPRRSGVEVGGLVTSGW